MISRAVSIDAPIGGWNTFDSLDNMPPDCAIILDNLIPSAGTVDTRKGTILYGDTGTGKPVETVASLDTNLESKLIVASGGGIWDMTDTPIIELYPEGTFQNDRWQTNNFRKLDEEGILIMCNGEDEVQILESPYTALVPMVANDGSEEWVYNWTRIADHDVTTPAAGEWNMNVAQTLLRINWTDDAAESRQLPLQLGSGSVVTLENLVPPLPIVYTKFQTTGDYVEQVGYTEYTGSIIDTLGGGAAVGALQTVSGGGGEIPANFIGVVVFKGRAYYWYDDDDSFWYSQAGSYQGELQEFPLGSVAQKGGKIVMMTTWTQQDSGDGKDDFLVIVFSTGEILIYQGDDPETAGFFEMVGRYITAEPLSVRGRDKYGSDIIIMTKDGYIALSTIVQQGRISDVPAFSRLITDAIRQRTQNTYLTYGWQATLFAREGLFLFNVPVTEVKFEQHVLNTVTQKWCRFTDIDVNCMTVHDERLYGGTDDGRVIGMMEGTSDQNEPINFTALPAFNYYGQNGINKMLTAAQIISTHTSPQYIDLRGYSDFNYPSILPEIPATDFEDVGEWDVSLWDEDFWAKGDVPFTTSGWQNCSAYGYAVSVMVRFSKLNEGVRWRSTGIRFNIAGAQ